MSAINVDELVSNKTQAQYPILVIGNANDTIPLVTTTLEKGDMQLVLIYNGQKKVIGKISESAHNISKLLRTCGSIEYMKAKDESYEIHSVAEYLDCVS